MSITVYSKPGCIQCKYTYAELDKTGLPYKTVDVTQDPSGVAAVQEMGYQSLPVVVAGDSHWSGFRPDNLRALAV